MAKTILVAEDEELISQALAAKLQFEKYEVLRATDGEMALQMAQEEHPDLILLDLLMPKMDGYEVLKELREDEWGKTVPVIVLTNKDNPSDVLEGLMSSAHDYFIKAETGFETLLKSIHDLLND